ncbi:MAG: response regulator, partial [Methylococcales bacterium]|nr:response regulator [Methylococcales bacterium]
MNHSLENSTQQATILIVENNKINSAILQEHIDKMGFKSITAVDGEIALEILQSSNIDLVLAEIMIPNMTGRQLLAHIRETPKLAHIPVIMCTAIDSTHSIAKCLEEGADDYIVKPYNTVILKARVTASLERKKRHDQEQYFHQEMLKKQQIIEEELHQAAEYINTRLPQRLQSNIKTNWLFLPCSTLGGDAFSYFELDDDHFVLFLLDVSGHGIGSSLLAVTVLDTISNQFIPDVDFSKPGDVALALNNHFKMIDHNGKYFTLWYGVYSHSKRQLTYASCGHPGALLTKQNQVNQRLTTGGVAITGFETGGYTEATVSIDADDK